MKFLFLPLAMFCVASHAAPMSVADLKDVIGNGRYINIAVTGYVPPVRVYSHIAPEGVEVEGNFYEVVDQMCEMMTVQQNTTDQAWCYTK